MIAQHISVSTGYFETMRASLLQGRYLPGHGFAGRRAGDRRQPDVRAADVSR